MTIAFYEHPFSSYVQKAKTALYEKGIPFESKMIDGSEPVASEFAALWPIQRFPVIVDEPPPTQKLPIAPIFIADSVSLAVSHAAVRLRSALRNSIDG
jgi:glutathione S-transferase